MRLLIPLFALLLAGCAQDEFADLKSFMAQAGQDGQHALEPLPQIQQIEEFHYLPGEYPDPFMPRSMKPSRGSGALQPDLNRQREFLESFPLDALRMVGTLEKGGQRYALIKTPDGSVNGVKKGNYLGQNYGLVVGIAESGIELREMVQDATGEWTESKAMMALQE